jgi:hypothetical protein
MPTLEAYIAATPECPDPSCRESLWWVDHAASWVCAGGCGTVFPALTVYPPMLQPA